jgi:hypothetical protein
MPLMKTHILKCSVKQSISNKTPQIFEYCLSEQTLNKTPPVMSVSGVVKARELTAGWSLSQG